MKKKAGELFDTAIVSKRNVLNEIRKNNMSLQELRFFSIYLSKINSHDISTRIVRFPLSDFQKIMEIGADMNINHFRATVRKLLQQIVEVPSESGYGYTAFQLFKECTLERDENDEWYVEIDAHDKALPLMFDFKNKYFSYELWNALRLKSPNQIRMYEILKQYEKIGQREISVLKLREMLGILPKEYERWDNFKRKVLDSCQQALKENTDICYTYERGKAGAGGKWLSVVFYISKNMEYKDRLSLDEFIDMQPEPEIIDINAEEEFIELSACVASDENIHIRQNEEDSSFIKDTEVQEVEWKLLKKLARHTLKSEKESEVSDFIEFCKIKMEKIRSKGKNINSPTDYLCTIIENSAEEFKKAQLKREEKEQSYDINEFEKYAINYEEFKKVDKEDKASKIKCDSVAIDYGVLSTECTEIPQNEPCNSLADKQITQKQIIWHRSQCGEGYWEYLVNKKKIEGDACGFEIEDDTIIPFDDNSKDENYDEIDGQLTMF